MPGITQNSVYQATKTQQNDQIEFVYSGINVLFYYFRI